MKPHFKKGDLIYWPNSGPISRELIYKVTDIPTVQTKGDDQFQVIVSLELIKAPKGHSHLNGTKYANYQLDYKIDENEASYIAIFKSSSGHPLTRIFK